MKTDVQCEMSRRREGQTEGEKQAWKGQGSVVAVKIAEDVPLLFKTQQRYKCVKDKERSCFRSVFHNGE